MLKIWAKTLVNKDKIQKDLLFTRPEPYAADKFQQYLMEICYEMDIPTPVVLKSHRHNFSQFNTPRFRASDFVESVDFETLVLENVSD